MEGAMQLFRTHFQNQRRKDLLSPLSAKEKRNESSWCRRNMDFTCRARDRTGWVLLTYCSAQLHQPFINLSFHFHSTCDTTMFPQFQERNRGSAQQIDFRRHFKHNWHCKKVSTPWHMERRPMEEAGARWSSHHCLLSSPSAHRCVTLEVLHQNKLCLARGMHLVMFCFTNQLRNRGVCCFRPSRWRWCDRFTRPSAQENLWQITSTWVWSNVRVPRFQRFAPVLIQARMLG